MHFRTLAVVALALVTFATSFGFFKVLVNPIEANLIGGLVAFCGCLMLLAAAIIEVQERREDALFARRIRQ